MKQPLSYDEFKALLAEVIAELNVMFDNDLENTYYAAVNMLTYLQERVENGANLRDDLLTWFDREAIGNRLLKSSQNMPSDISQTVAALVTILRSNRFEFGADRERIFELHQEVRDFIYNNEKKADEGRFAAAFNNIYAIDEKKQYLYSIDKERYKGNVAHHAEGQEPLSVSLLHTAFPLATQASRDESNFGKELTAKIQRIDDYLFSRESMGTNVCLWPARPAEWLRPEELPAVGTA